MLLNVTFDVLWVVFVVRFCVVTGDLLVISVWFVGVGWVAEFG